MGCSSSTASPAQSSFTDVEKLQTLGEGAHAQIFKARCKATGSFCAMKLAHSHPVSATLLEEEAAILQQLDHPHIAKLLGSGRGPRGPYIAIELCHGGDMFDCLGREGRLSEQVASQVMKQLLGAVMHMHSQGICHRDLKEENILVAAPGPIESMLVKVCDFGIAQRDHGPELAANLCTPAYAAPDVLAGESGGKAGDLWSCGVILYSLLCGCLPFEGNSRAEVLTRVRSGGPSFDEATWSGVSDSAVGLIRRLLRTDRHKRYTAEQVLKHPWVARQAPSGTCAEVPACLLAQPNSAAQVAQLSEEIGELEGSALPWELSAALRRAGIQEDPAVFLQLEEEAAHGSGLVDCATLLMLNVERPTMKRLLGTEASCQDPTLGKSFDAAVSVMHRRSTVRRRSVKHDKLERPKDVSI